MMETGSDHVFKFVSLVLELKTVGRFYTAIRYNGMLRNVRLRRAEFLPRILFVRSTAFIRRRPFLAKFFR